MHNKCIYYTYTIQYKYVSCTLYVQYKCSGECFGLPNRLSVTYFEVVVLGSVDESLTSPYITLYDWITPLGTAGSSHVILTDDDEVDSNVRFCTGPGAYMVKKGQCVNFC